MLSHITKNLLYVAVLVSLIIASILFVANSITPVGMSTSALAVDVVNPRPISTTAPVATTPTSVPVTAIDITTHQAAVTNTPNYSNSTPSPNKAASTIRLDPAPSLQQTSLAGVLAAVYIPEKVKTQQSTQVIIALHGMGGKGDAICKGLVTFAEQNGVILLAPTFNYNSNWQDPQIVTEEDPIFAAKLNQMVNELESETQLHLKNHLLLYGFSRGAQLAHRYALLYPDRTLGVAVLSAGSYTLPYKINTGKSTQPMPFPFGVNDVSKYTGKSFDQANFDKINFSIEVGALDNDPGQTPPAWDTYLGRSRLDRAQAFYRALKQEGLSVQITVFPDTAHQETSAMRSTALTFFKGLIAS